MSKLTFDSYRSFASLERDLESLAARHSDLASVQSLGESPEGRPIYCVTLTSSDKRTAAEKPALYVDGGIHAQELTGTAAAMHMLRYLAAGTQESDLIRDLLQSVTLYVVPRVSPDGAEAVLSGTAPTRSSPRPYPSPTIPSGLIPQDVDGDGRVREMRVEDPRGGWKKHPDDPRLMIERQIDERGGEYYRVMPEGRLKGVADRRVFAEPSSPYGLDFNRNFPEQWRHEPDQKGAGAHPLSEPETAAIASFIGDHLNIGTCLTLHTGIEVVLFPSGAKPFHSFPAADRRHIRRIGRRMAELLNMPAECGLDIGYGEIYGEFSEWCYLGRGIPAYVVEIWSPFQQAGVSLEDHIRMFRDEPWKGREYNKKVLDWLDEQFDGDDLASWNSFSHPDLGQVEIGGIDPFIYANAPDSHLATICQRTTDAAVVAAQALPRLDIVEQWFEPIGDNVIQVGAIVAKDGVLPTYLTQQAKNIGAAHPIKARIEIDGNATLVSGQPEVTLGHIDNRGWRVRAEWVLRTRDATSDPDVEISFASPTAGTRSIRLG